MSELDESSEYAVEIGASQLYQVVLNLLVNARDALQSSGTIRLRSRTSPLPAAAPRLDAAAHAGDDGLLISVSDNGMGIDSFTMQRLFEPFFTTKSHGSGLGLATAYGLVRACGGEMFVESKLDVGTEFVVWIPQHVEPKSERPSRVVPSGRPAREQAVKPASEERQRILLCDDDSMILEALTRVLRDLGHEVTHASNLSEAWEQWQRGAQHFSVVVTDRRLGKADGLELSRRILSDRPDINVVLMSGDFYSVDTQDPVWHQVTHLQKPFNRASLCAAISNRRQR